MTRFKIENKLRKEFIERMEAILDEDFVVEEVEDLIHDFCNELKRIDAIRNTLKGLVKDLAD